MTRRPVNNNIRPVFLYHQIYYRDQSNLYHPSDLSKPLGTINRRPKIKITTNNAETALSTLDVTWYSPVPEQNN